MAIFTEQSGGLVYQHNYETLLIQAWGHNSLRVRATTAGSIRDDLPGALISQGSSGAQITVGEKNAFLRNGSIEAQINHLGQLCFVNSETGEELFAELPQPTIATEARIYKPVAGDSFILEANFRACAGEHFYGLGQHTHGLLDQKGCVIDLIQVNTEVSIPFLVSSRGYGFLWNNPAIGRVELGQNRTRWVAQDAYQHDWWITTGTPSEILEAYADATGHPRMLPEWAAGFWQSKLRYRTQEELLTIAREYQRRNLPLSVIVIDYYHWTAQGDWKFKSSDWPDPTRMVRELAQMGVRVMVSIWPSVTPYSENFLEMQARGFLVRGNYGTQAFRLLAEPNFGGKSYLLFYDATHPEARKFVWDHVHQGYYSHGIKIWWLDACEPDANPLSPENQRYHLGSGLSVGNIYPLMNARTFFDGMQAEHEEEIVLLCRSAWAGSQRYGAAVWSGDIPSTFESLQAQVRAGLNMAMSGIPWWTTDIGGFYTPDPQNLEFVELLIRWFQYGVFCPLFRLHGWRTTGEAYWDTGGPNEVWSYGEEAYTIIKEQLFLRERLRPYIMEQMRRAHETGLPVMRPVFVDYPKDEEAYQVEDEFLFGPDILVAPILLSGQRSRRVYLPAGQKWQNAWSGDKHDGDCYVEADAPMEHIPIFVRDGMYLGIKP